MVAFTIVAVTAIFLSSLDYTRMALSVEAGLFPHRKNTREAEAHNQRVWNRGTAQIYTVQASIEVDGERRVSSTEVICVPKIETARADIKGGPYVWDIPRIHETSPLMFQYSQDMRILYEVGYSCDSLSGKLKRVGLPFTYSGYTEVHFQHLTDPVMSCRIWLYDGPVEFVGLRVHLIDVISVRQAPVKEVLTREEYGPADRALLKKRNRSISYADVNLETSGQTYYWQERSNCWGVRAPGGDICKGVARQMCPKVP